MADYNAEPGDTLTAQFEVENTGGLEGTEDINLTRANGNESIVDVVEDITLDGSEIESGELVWETDTGLERDTYELCVVSSETEDEDCVTVHISDIENYEITDTFEDESVTTTTNDSWGDWEGDTDSFSLETDSPLYGSNSGSLTASGGESVTVSSERDSSTTADRVLIWSNISDVTDESNDSVSFELLKGSDAFAAVEFEQSGDDILVNGDPTDNSWSSENDYEIEIESIDFSEETFSWQIYDVEGGSVVDSDSGVNFQNSVSSYDSISVSVDNSEGSDDVTLIIDQPKI